MRQKMITLDPTSWEYAAKMKNFSGWVRKKLAEEFLDHAEKELSKVEWKAYCAECDVTATSPHKVLMEYKYCPQCHKAMKFMGQVE